MRIKTFIYIISFLTAIRVSAQLRPSLHVDGIDLRDEAGNKVVLHGVSDSPSPSSNDLRWGLVASDDSIKACLSYFNELFTAVTDTASGAHADVFRLHIDPVWTNNPNAVSDGLHSGESDISRFSANRLKTYMKNLYWKLISDALGHGMYVVVRPPGICQGTISVDGEYQEYLMDVWDIITSNDSIRKYSGQISLELATEPASVTDADGVARERSMHDFFQPIVDLIRENGFDGIIWVPGKTWQADFRSFVSYPINDNNYGFAVHNYSGWFEISDNNCDKETAIKNFGRMVPVVRTNPILITATDWSPEKEGTGHYDDEGNWVYNNYGTWGTATTSKWGLAFRAILDNYENVGVIAASTSAYIDIDNYIKEGKVTPAFQGVDEACGEPLMQWFGEWADTLYPSNVRYYEDREISDNPFDVKSDNFTAHLLYENEYYEEDSCHVLDFQSGGCIGWRFEKSLDLSEYQYMTITLNKIISRYAVLKIYDTTNIWAEPYILDLSNSGTQFTVNLRNMVTESGRRLDASNIRIVSFYSLFDQNIYLKDITLEYPNHIEDINEDTDKKEGITWGLNGCVMSDSEDSDAKVFIRNGKKYINRR